MVQKIYSRQPAFRVDLPASTSLLTKLPVTKAATARAVEPSPSALVDAALRNNIPRLLRLRQIIAPNGPIPVSKNTWLAWVDAKYAPAPHPLSKRIKVWLESDIIAFITLKTDGTKD